MIPVEPGFLNYVLREPLGVVGPDRAVELPADVPQLEDGPGARCRQHGRAQAGGAHAALVAPARRADGRGRVPAGRRQHRPGVRHDGRRSISPTHPDVAARSRFTGSTAVGPADRGGVGGQPEARPARARRQGRQHRLRRRGPGRGGRGLGVRHLPQPGPGLHRRVAADPARVDRRRVPRGLRARWPDRSGSAIPLDPATEMGPLTLAEHRDRVLGVRRRSRSTRAAEILTGGTAPDDPALAKRLLRRADRGAGTAERPRVAGGGLRTVRDGDHVRRSTTRRSRSRTATDYGLGGGLWTRDLAAGAPDGRGDRIRHGLDQLLQAGRPGIARSAGSAAPATAARWASRRCTSTRRPSPSG